MAKLMLFLIAMAIIVIIVIIGTIVSILYIIDFTSSYNRSPFIEDCVYYHNYYREDHKHTKPLILSNRLVKWATKRVLKISTTDGISSTVSNFGENVWSKKVSHREEYDELSCALPIEEWYSEKKYYYYGIPWPTIPLTKRFTQVVWRSTKEVGCAKAYHSDEAIIYVVCLYDPKGNVFSKYRTNVLQKKYK